MAAASAPGLSDLDSAMVDDDPLVLSEEQFKLSTTLSDHVKSCRDVCVLGDDLVVVLEEWGRVVVYSRTGSGQRSFIGKPFEAPVHAKGMSFCIAPLPLPELPADSMISGGGDFTAKIFTAEDVMLQELRGHENSVNSVSHTADGRIVTGSWDGTARVWRHGETRQIIRGHVHGVEVSVLPSGRLVTGSGNKEIWIHEPEGYAVAHKIRNAHDHNIRKIVPHPLGFASCANDGRVKVWSEAGDLLVDIPAHTTDTKFVYGLAVLPEGELVSGGEDRSLAFWSPDGRLLQRMNLPGVIGGIKVLPCGDVAVACSDRCTRIFTRSPSRMVSAAEQQEFDELMKLVRSSGPMETLDPTSFADEKRLLQPGKKDGDVIVVNLEDRGPTAYQWSLAKLVWDEIGAVTGKVGAGGGGDDGGGSKSQYEGKHYDFVTDVVITPEWSATLAFNRDEDPDQVAADFCAKNGLPPDYRDQIRAHVAPLVDPVLISQRKADQARSAQKVLKHIPGSRSVGRELFPEVRQPQMINAILATNQGLEAAPESLSEPDLQLLHEVVRAATSLVGEERDGLALGPKHVQVLEKLLSWPQASLSPVFDLIRVACLAPALARALSSGFWNRVLTAAMDSGKAVNFHLVVKALSNFVCHLPRSAGGLLPAHWELLQLLAGSVFVNAAAQPSNIRQSVATLAHNLAIWLARFGERRFEAYEGFLVSMAQVATAGDSSPRTVFYALLTLGSVAHQDEELKRAILDRLKIHDVADACAASADPTVRELADEVRTVIE